MRLAIVHDFLNQYGGAERCLEVFLELAPDAPVFTLLRDPAYLPGVDVRPSPLQMLPGICRSHYRYLPLYPWAIDRLDLSEFDVILSSSPGFAKNVRRLGEAYHLCYCYSPMRFAYDGAHHYLEGLPPPGRLLATMLLRQLRLWDVVGSGSVDRFVTVSHHIRGKILQRYRRCAEVVYPPVDTDFFSGREEKPGSYYLAVARLVRHKRVDLAIEACNRLRRPLKVVGVGPERRRLERLAGSRVELLGRVSDAELRALYRGCRALVSAGEEDFGLAAVEAQACRRPVIGYGVGGLAETVIDGQTGTLFYRQTVEDLIGAIREHDSRTIDPERCRQNALGFSLSRFRDRMRSLLDAATSEARRRTRLATAPADPSPRSVGRRPRHPVPACPPRPLALSLRRLGR